MFVFALAGSALLVDVTAVTTMVCLPPIYTRVGAYRRHQLLLHRGVSNSMRRLKAYGTKLIEIICASSPTGAMVAADQCVAQEGNYPMLIARKTAGTKAVSLAWRIAHSTKTAHQLAVGPSCDYDDKRCAVGDRHRPCRTADSSLTARIGE